MNAAEIYFKAIRKARRDHEKLIARFLNGKIDIISPCGMDRERDYIITAFQTELDVRASSQQTVIPNDGAGKIPGLR